MIPEALSVSSIAPALLLCVVASLSSQEAGPAAEAARVARLAGEWDAQVLFPGAPPVAGHASIRLLQGGSWAVEDFDADMRGAPFRGHGLFGWDARRNHYANVWVDNMESKLNTGAGQWDEATTSFILRAEMDFGGGPVTIRETWRFAGKDAFTFTLAPDTDGAEAAMTIKYTRRK
jgi:Protein of unknown function (DUF1579)